MVKGEEAEGKSGRKWMTVESESVQLSRVKTRKREEETVTGRYDNVTIGGRSTELC
jgi:hypothetical protein